ncbi:SRPBCC family protein [Kitasatospora sp. NPDC059571]|uniref:SRPBCC family protein n=1 Tax=Kitasatospora sp. NPDC059571 TaxID=3346871 RepID=UPI003687EAB8
MIEVRRTITVARPLDEVARYLADFSRTEEWDPGTVRCTRVGDGPVAPGARWHNVSRFRGRTTELDYRLDRLESGRLVFVGANRTVTATDDIGLTAATGATTVVDYRATLEFKGLARLAAPFLRAEFERLADRVAVRLPEALAGQ